MSWASKFVKKNKKYLIAAAVIGGTAFLATTGVGAAAIGAGKNLLGRRRSGSVGGIQGAARSGIKRGIARRLEAVSVRPRDNIVSRAVSAPPRSNATTAQRTGYIPPSQPILSPVLAHVGGKFGELLTSSIDRGGTFLTQTVEKLLPIDSPVQTPVMAGTTSFWGGQRAMLIVTIIGVILAAMMLFRKRG